MNCTYEGFGMITSWTFDTSAGIDYYNAIWLIGFMLFGWFMTYIYFKDKQNKKDKV